MSGIGIGTHDRGTFDREDELFIKKNALKTGLTAKQAEDFSRNNSGAEAIIKLQDGTYSVYGLETSESGKTINNEDFSNGSIDLNVTDIHQAFYSGKKAYVMTSDNVIRSLEIQGIELNAVNQDFIRAKLNVVLEDLDGIDKNSSDDLEGTISGKISIANEFLQYSIIEANKHTGSVELGLNTKIKDQELEIPVSVKGITLAYITMKMEQGGINVKVEQSGLVTAAQIAILPLSLVDAEEIATDLIKKEIAKNLGLKVVNISDNQFKLVPDLKNNSIIEQLKVGDMNLKLEEIKTDYNNTFFQLDRYGDLQINFTNAKVIGSSDTSAPIYKSVDSEGTDSISASIDSAVNNDLSATIGSNSSVKIRITEAEQSGLANRVKKMSGMGISANGNVEINNVKTSVEVDNGAVKTSVSKGDLNIKDINVTAGEAKLTLESTTGKLGLTEKDNKLILNTDNVKIKGAIENNSTKVTFNDLVMDGNLIYDKGNPNKIKIETTDHTGIKISVDFKDKKSGKTNSVQNASFQGTDVEIDVAKGNLSVSQSKEGTAAIINRVKVGETDLKNVSFKGKVNLETKTGKLELVSKELSFSGNISGLEIKNLRGSGTLSYDPATGIKLKNTDINASGKIGGFDIARFKAKGDISFDKNGNLLVTRASAIELDSSLGLAVKGDLSVANNNGIYTFNTISGKPVDLSYRPKGSKTQLISDLVIEGKITYNSNNSTVSFNNGKNDLVIKSGKIADVPLNNFKLSGEISYKDGKITAFNSKGSTTISGKVGSININEIKSSGPVVFDTGTNKLSWSKEVSVTLPDQNISLKTSGNVSFTEKDGKYLLTSNNGIISGNIAGVEMKDLKLDGSLIFDPKTSELLVSGTEKSKLKMAGSIYGREIDFSSEGAISFLKDKEGSTKIKADKVKLEGTIDGFNLNSSEGASAEVTISSEGKLKDISGFKFNFTVDGINLTNRGGLQSNEEGYEIAINGGLINNEDNLVKFFDKLASNKIIPENAKDILRNINSFMAETEINKLEYENLKVNLDKDFSFKGFSISTKDLDISSPENGYKINAAGKITLDLEKDQKIAITSHETKINATLGKTEFTDFNLKGKVTYDLKKGEISFNGIENDNLELSGKIAGRNLSLNSSGKIKLTENEGNYIFEGDKIRINGELEGIKLESIGDSAGKFILKKDGKIDLSQLEFNFKLEGVSISNKNGGIKNDGKGYEIKFTGDLNSESGSLIKFLDKVATDKAIPESVKEYIGQVRKTMKEFEIYGDLKNARYEDLSIRLDDNFKIQNYSAKVEGSLTKASMAMNLTTEKHKFNFDQVDLKMEIDSKADEFRIKKGNLSFSLNQELRDQIKKQAIDLIQERMGLEKVNLDVLPNGNLKIHNATYKGLEVSDVDVKASTKFSGQNLIISLDKVDVKGFLGVLSDVAQAFGAIDPEKMAAGKIMENIDTMKMHYNNDEELLSLDLQEILYQNVSEDISLENVSVSEQGKMSVDFSVNIGGQKPYNPAIVNKNVDQIKSLLQKETSNENAQRLKNILVDSSPADLSRTLDRVNIAPVNSKLKKEENVLPVLEKLLESSNSGKNAFHLHEFMTFANDDLSYDLQKKIKDEDLQKLSPEIKLQMIQKLFDGHTSGSEELAVKRLIVGSSAQDLSKILSRISLERLSDELEDREKEIIMKKLVENSAEGDNKKHLQGLTKQINDTVSFNLLKSLSDGQVRDLPLSVKVDLIHNLSSGYTSGEEEQQIKRIFMASEKADANRLMDTITLQKIREELDSKDVTEILRKINR